MLFTRRIEADIALAKARGFKNSLDAAANFRDGLPEGAAFKPIESARAHVDLAVRYGKLVARAYGVARASYGEILARSPWSFTGSYTVPEAMNLVIESQAQFGPEHQRSVRELFAKPWLHLASSPKKSSETGVFIQVGGGNPYGITTYTGDLSSVRTLASISQSLIMDANIGTDDWPNRREEDQPIFGNARWAMSQFLVDDLLLGRATDPKQRASMLLDHLSLLWTQFFYRAALTELEAWIMSAIEKGAPPTALKSRQSISN